MLNDNFKEYNISIKKDDKKVRKIISNKNFNIGDTIIIDYSLSSIPKLTNLYCNFCLNLINNLHINCICKIFNYCNKKCYNSDISHLLICNKILNILDDKHSQFNYSTLKNFFKLDESEIQDLFLLIKYLIYREKLKDDIYLKY